MTEETMKQLLDECYDVICRAIYTEDGLDESDGEELLNKIKAEIGQTQTIKAWDGE